MKKVFEILGMIFAVVLVIVVIAAVILIPRALKLNNEATAYVQGAVPKIVEHWNPQELSSRATFELLTAMKSQGETNQLFLMFGKLGALKHLEPPKGAINSSVYTGRGVMTVGNYTIQGEFENGSATIQIQVQLAGNTWRINGFHVNSDAFLPSKAQ